MSRLKPATHRLTAIPHRARPRDVRKDLSVI